MRRSHKHTLMVFQHIERFFDGRLTAVFGMRSENGKNMMETLRSSNIARQPPSMPDAFDRYSSFTDLAALKAASNRPLRKSLRVNTLKSSVEQFRKRAGERGWTITQVPWCAEGFFVDRDDRSVALGKDLLHLLGHVYMQEAASMLPPALLDPQPGDVILDMSAAPGSKTTQIASKMQEHGLIIANDVQEKRLWTLKTALHRCGVINNIVTKKVGQWFAKNMTERFDRILCDAPCTAQGTSRKDSDALLYCSENNIGKMARLQRELLESAIHACKVGGRIVYSTCTLTPEENEDVAVSIMNKFPDQVEAVDPRGELGIANDELLKIFDAVIKDSHRVQDYLATLNPQSAIRNLPFIRLWPHTFDTEGFFCAVFKKVAPTKYTDKLLPVRFQEESLPPARQKDVGKICEELYGASFLRENDRLFLRADQLILANDAVAECRLPVLNYALGIPFARKLDGTRIRLSHEAITLRGHEAARNVLDIGEDDVTAMLAGKDIECPVEMFGDPILKCGDLIIGSSLAQHGILKNRLPRWLVQRA